MKKQESTLEALSPSAPMKKKLKSLHISKETLTRLAGSAIVQGDDAQTSGNLPACEPTIITGP